MANSKVKDIKNLIDKPLWQRTDFDDQLEEYILFMAVEKGLAHTTIYSYYLDLSKFQTYLAEIGIEDASKATQQNILAYLNHLSVENITKRSSARKLSAIKGFFKFLRREEVVKINPTQNLETPKLQKTLPRVLSIAEIDQLLSLPNTENYYGKRDKAMLELMYATGFRVSELVSVKTDNVNLTAGFAQVVGKGNKERIAPIGNVATAAVTDYLENSRHILAKGKRQDELFLNHRGEPITRQGFWLIIKKYGKMLNLGFQIKPHTLRHSVATHMLENGANLAIVQEVLGHKNISTTEIYTHVSSEHLRAVYSEAHPRAKLDKND